MEASTICRTRSGPHSPGGSASGPARGAPLPPGVEAFNSANRSPRRGAASPLPPSAAALERRRGRRQHPPPREDSILPQVGPPPCCLRQGPAASSGGGGGALQPAANTAAPRTRRDGPEGPRRRRAESAPILLGSPPCPHPLPPQRVPEPPPTPGTHRYLGGSGHAGPNIVVVGWKYIYAGAPGGAAKGDGGDAANDRGAGQCGRSPTAPG